MLAAVVAAAALPAPALAADGPPPGTYKAKITAPARLKGTWSLAFAKNGTYTITRNGKIVVRGRDLSIAPQMQLSKETGPLRLQGARLLQLQRSGKTLTFERLNDKKCAGRALVLSHRFTLVT
jgi:hypothetical protein